VPGGTARQHRGGMEMHEIVRFDAVRVRTDDLARAARRYASLLGAEPERVSADVVRFALARGVVELVPGAPGAQALRLTATGAGGANGERALDEARAARFGGIEVLVDPPRAGALAAGSREVTALDTATPTAGGFLAIDHLVINTPDPERAIGLWRDRLGVRLALDREFPHRGLRMLFFRSAGVTLEYVSPIGSAGTGDDLLNGVAYRVADLDRVRERLLAAGLDVSEVRTGNKQGTRVATVRNETESVPTLLIEAAPAKR
jgi:catechol 2,3-dioxygenase-like lactoylglutathione lyase family enzyme